MSNEQDEDALESVAERALRADARRNEDALLDAAKRVFAEVSVDAPIREMVLVQ
jgi:hypothetical protein